MSRKKVSLLSAGLSAGLYFAYKFISNKIKNKENKEVIIETSAKTEGDVTVYEPVVKKKTFGIISKDSNLRKVLRYGTVPTIIGVGTFSILYLPKKGYNQAKVASVTIVSIKVLIYFLEQIIPKRDDWNVNDGKEVQDILHTIIGTFVGAGLGKLTNDFVMSYLHQELFEKRGIKTWPTQLPYIVQIPMVFLLADLGRYIQHRLMHQYASLWKYHELHHDVDKMGVLKTSRSHITERFFQAISLFGVLSLLGASKTPVEIYMVSNSILGMIDHSNLDIDLGKLTYIFTGPAEHHIHHSRDMKESNTNFGSALVIWDILFGTYTDPRKFPDSPIELGVEGDLPQNFKEQFMMPFYSNN